MNETSETKYPTKKVIKNYVLFGSLLFNLPAFVNFLLVGILNGFSNSTDMVVVGLGLIFGFVGSAIILAIVGYLLSDLKIKITKPADYYQPFTVAFAVSLVVFFLMGFMAFSALAGLLISLFLAIFTGIISAVLAKFILPKS